MLSLLISRFLSLVILKFSWSMQNEVVNVTKSSLGFAIGNSVTIEKQENIRLKIIVDIG